LFYNKDFVATAHDLTPSN